MVERGFETIGIIGAGPRGTDIAAYALFGRYCVILEDVSSARLDQARAHISGTLKSAVAREEIDTICGREIAANFATVQSIDKVLRAADLLIEAAPEDAEVQLEIFTIFDKFAKPYAILASATRAVSIAHLAEMTNCPERCVGLHFPGSATPDRALHIIRAPKTSDRTAQMCEDFARTLGFAPRSEIEMANEPPATEKAHFS